MNNISIIHTCADQYRDQIIQLWYECLPGTPEERFKWLSQGNPAGSAEWFLAINDKNGVLVGTSSVTPKELVYNGQKLRGGIVGDVMVAPAFRKKGIARQIQEVIAGRLPLMEIEFLYVVPNNKSEPLFSQSGFSKIFLLQNYLVLVDVDHYLKKYFNKTKCYFAVKWIGHLLESFLGKAFNFPGIENHVSVSSTNSFDEEFDVLWESVKNVPNQLVGSKSTDYLAWKYSANPNVHFRILHYRKSSGAIVGYCVFTVEGAKIHIFELVSVKNKYYAQLISAMRSFAKAEQCVGIYFYTTRNNPVLKALGWRALRIGGDMHLLCSGEIFEKTHFFLFFPGDRNF